MQSSGAVLDGLLSISQADILAPPPSTEQETSPQAVHQLVEYLATEGVLLPLARSLRRLSFDARKDAQAIFCSVFRFRVPAPTPSGPNQHPLPSLPNKTGEPENETDPLISAHIINDSPEIITSLCLGYDYRESALACGNILREALKHDSMAALILYDEPLAEGQKHPGLKGVDPNIPGSGNGVFWRFFDWMDKSVFEVSADAFTTFSVSFVWFSLRVVLVQRTSFDVTCLNCRAPMHALLTINACQIAEKWEFVAGRSLDQCRTSRMLCAHGWKRW